MTWMSRILQDLIKQTSIFQTSPHRPMARMVILPDAKRVQPIMGPRSIRAGNLIIFQYFAATKSLPYYDQFPAVLALTEPTAQDHTFLGINFHYLPPALRILLFTYFLAIQNVVIPKKRLVPDSALRLVRALCKKYPYTRALYHRYRIDHFQSPVHLVPPSEYPFMLTMPTEMFLGANLPTVYYHSLRTKRQTF